MISFRRWVVGTFALASFAQLACADTLHSFGGGLFWHHDSGWLFPERIGEFARVGMPQDVAGSTDVNAHYARVVGERVSASIDVYAADSALNEPTFELARQALERELASSEHEMLPETLLRVGDARSFEGTRAVFEVADEAAPLRALYFVDMGDWIVKVRVAIPSHEQRLLDTADAFVQALRWDSLGSEPPTQPVAEQARRGEAVQ